MKPNIPLTWMTRQLKEMAEKEAEEAGASAGDGGTLTRTPRASRDDSTLKRHHAVGGYKGPTYRSPPRLRHLVAPGGS